jgi:RHS repeat-associated protein
LDVLQLYSVIAAGASFIDYSYEGVSETLAKATPSSGSATMYSNTLGGPLAQKAGSNATQVLMRDLHGDVIAAVNAGGNATASQSWYSAWGERTGTSSDIGFQGQLTDDSTLEVDMSTRMYSASRGRFTSRDSLSGSVEDPMSLNQFAYVTGNPITYADPTGMGRCEDPYIPGCPLAEENQTDGGGGHHQDGGEGDQGGGGGRLRRSGTGVPVSSRPLR